MAGVNLIQSNLSDFHIYITSLYNSFHFYHDINTYMNVHTFSRVYLFRVFVAKQEKSYQLSYGNVRIQAVTPLRLGYRQYYAHVYLINNFFPSFDDQFCKGPHRTLQDLHVWILYQQVRLRHVSFIQTAGTDVGATISPFLREYIRQRPNHACPILYFLRTLTFQIHATKIVYVFMMDPNSRIHPIDNHQIINIGIGNWNSPKVPKCMKDIRTI